MSSKFQLVQVQELDDSFAQPLSSKDIKDISRNTGIPKQYVIHEIVFAAPRCNLATSYIQWTKSQDPNDMYLKTKHMDVAKFIDIHGPDSIKKFYNTMMVHGHPYQPVRVVRDSRMAVTDSLDDMLTYVSP